METPSIPTMEQTAGDIPPFTPMETEPPPETVPITTEKPPLETLTFTEPFSTPVSDPPIPAEENANPTEPSFVGTEYNPIIDAQTTESIYSTAEVDAKPAEDEPKVDEKTPEASLESLLQETETAAPPSTGADSISTPTVSAANLIETLEDEPAAMDFDTNDNIKDSAEEEEAEVSPSKPEQEDEEEEEEVEEEEHENNVQILYDDSNSVQILGSDDNSQQEIVVLEGYEAISSSDGKILQLQSLDSEHIYIMSPEDENDPEPEPEVAKSESGAVKPKKPRGRRPAKEIPLHVLGRNINNPIEPVQNGRTLPKPRLGVKVPYTNLTSQIVSREEIQKEIMDRARSKQEQNKSRANVIFARKCMQNLAKKIGAIADTEPAESKEKEKGNKEKDTGDNADLLAILEGDDDEDSDMPVLTKEVKPVETTEEDENNLRQLEREIALQQLQELPRLSPKQRTFKGKQIIVKKPLTGDAATKESVQRKIILTSASPKSSGDVEPQVKANMVLKTYSRKRKSTDISEFLDIKPKVAGIKAEPLPPNTYVTKSSRIIKKKVIWDPDEANKSPTSKLMVKEERGPEKKLLVERVVGEEKKSPTATPKKIATIVKVKKRLTEVDKLLMDEGAVNMIYDVKNTDETKKKQDVISLDRAHRELLKKTSEIKNDLQNTSKESPKSLRKKDTLSPVSPPKPQASAAQTRKASKDSAKSGTPPPSPAYVFQQNAEASRIIRRRSSSSISSGGESDGEHPRERTTRKKSASVGSDSPRSKRAKRNAEGDVLVKEEGTKDSANGEHVVKKVTKLVVSKYFTVKKMQHVANVALNYNNDECYYNGQILKELTNVLNHLIKDKDCSVVSLTSTGESFCLGIDYQILAADREDDRKKKANDLAANITEFLKCLLNYPKVLVAAVKGDCVGLGVTMLPLFDMVIASDTATFSTPYSELGIAAEAAFLLTVPHISNRGLASELLFTSQKMKAEDAFRRGLVTRLCWPEKYDEELKSILLSISKGDKQNLELIKHQLREGLKEDSEEALSVESELWIESWMSVDFQKHLKQLG